MKHIERYNLQKAEIEKLTRERDFYKAPSSFLAEGAEQIKRKVIKGFAEKVLEILDREEESGK